MFLVGLTGGIASGKSTVAQMFRDAGVPVVDADQIAREVVEPHRPAWQSIRSHFGDEVLHPDLTLNRERLGEIIFRDSEQRRLLNSLTHPHIYRAIAWQLLQLLVQGFPYALLDLPLLYETGTMLHFLHKTIVVTCTPEQQLQRLVERSRCSEEAALDRITAQLPLEEKVRRADLVIDNSGGLEATANQVNKLIQQLGESRHHWWLRAALAAVLGGTVAALAGWALSRLPLK